MKNVSLAVNAVLLVLIVILFFMYSSLQKKISPGAPASVSDTIKSNGLRVAYVNADSLDVKYKLMVALRTQMQQQQDALQQEFEKKGQVLQQEYANYQQKAQAGNISQVDAEKVQKDMQQKNNELDAIKGKMSDLAKEMQDKNIQLEQKVEDYINEYNKKAHYDYILTYISGGGQVLYANNKYDITNDILAGINKGYPDSTGTAAKPR